MIRPARTAMRRPALRPPRPAAIASAKAALKGPRHSFASLAIALQSALAACSSEPMTEKNRNTRAGSPGGDRPLRRPAKKTVRAARRRTPRRKAGKPASTNRARQASHRQTALGQAEHGHTALGQASSQASLGQARRASPRANATSALPSADASAALRPRPAKAFEGERIAKVMARAGVCSRRDAEPGSRKVASPSTARVLTSPAFNVRDNDNDHASTARRCRQRERTRLFLFHKPRRLVTTARDPRRPRHGVLLS